ncbi:RNA ligase 1 family protein [Parachryseolinea silvisoli]|uniref:RNA ligase 1 family protein n=1 Tax=Parachryseolinea silvisoli TaxID=2873601 RepID=UPI002265E845|nr:DUF5565 family protein [Parachryseolinea silvisoli]MCD9018825.1 DUF5565 family protein [Parachryseolinea silvisoli]
MKKISTLFQKDPNDLKRVINQVNPGNEWVLNGQAIATRKFDGTAAAIINGELYKRYDVKKGKQAPVNAIPCQEPDTISGHWPHWVKCEEGKSEDQFFLEGLKNIQEIKDGTYELVGPKVQGNPEKFDRHMLVLHGSAHLELPSLEFEALKEWLSREENDIEGIVFHHVTDGRMCKLRKSDFGIKRKKQTS